MKKTTLIFASLPELWNFRQATKITTFEINTDHRSLTGEFEPHEIELAVRTFHAVLFEDKINAAREKE